MAADQADPAAAPFAYAGDSAAMACARGQALEVRVYLAFGEQRARALLAEADPVAVLLEGLPGVPRRLRAVPATNAARAAGGAGAGGAGPVWERLRAGELSLDELPRGAHDAGAAGADPMIPALLGRTR